MSTYGDFHSFIGLAEQNTVCRTCTNNRRCLCLATSNCMWACCTSLPQYNLFAECKHRPRAPCNYEHIVLDWKEKCKMQHTLGSFQMAANCMLAVLAAPRGLNHGRVCELCFCSHESLDFWEEILVKIIISLMNEVVCVIPRMNPRHREYLSPRSTECDLEVQRLAGLLERNISVAPLRL